MLYDILGVVVLRDERRVGSGDGDSDLARFLPLFVGFDFSFSSLVSLSLSVSESAGTEASVESSSETSSTFPWAERRFAACVGRIMSSMGWYFTSYMSFPCAALRLRKEYEEAGMEEVSGISAADGTSSVSVISMMFLGSMDVRSDTRLGLFF
jgi:hypothetical protein